MRVVLLPKRGLPTLSPPLFILFELLEFPAGDGSCWKPFSLSRRGAPGGKGRARVNFCLRDEQIETTPVMDILQCDDFVKGEAAIFSSLF